VTRPDRILHPDDPSALERAIEALRADLLVAVPTETVYGLACALNDIAVNRLLEAKGRDAGKGITLLVDDLDDAADLVVASPAAARLAARLWPGPLTLVVPLRAGVVLPHAVTGGSDAVGLRVPDQAFTRRLARAMGPLPLTVRILAYRCWDLRGRPDWSEKLDWEAAERVLGQFIAEDAYFRWEKRGRPLFADPLADWLAAVHEVTETGIVPGAVADDRLRFQTAMQGAYLSWERRGRPFGNPLVDWPG